MHSEDMDKRGNPNRRVKRTDQIRLVLTDEERSRIDHAARVACLAPTTWVRSIALRAADELMAA